MNQIVAFLTPTAPSNAAGASARDNAAAAGEGFAAILAQLQALVGNAGADATAKTTFAQFQDLLGSSVPTTQATATTLPALEAPAPGQGPGDAPVAAQTLLDLIAALSGNTESKAKPILPETANADLDKTIAPQLAALQLALQNVQAQASVANANGKSETTPAAATQAHVAAAAVVTTQLGLRGTLAPTTATEPAQATNAQKPDASATQVPALPVAPPAAHEKLQPQTSAKTLAAPKRASAAPQNHAATTAELGAQRDARAPEPSASNNAQPTPAAALQQPIDKPSATQSQPTQTNAQPAAAPILPSTLAAQQFDVTVATAPQAPVPLEALAVHIARKFDSGSSNFEIRLHPVELGKVDISLSVADDGHVQAVLRAERPETLDMLQRDARALEQQLRQAGLDVGSNSLSFSLSSGNKGRETPFNGWPAFADANDVASAAKDEATAKYIAVRTRDGLDIRV